MGVKRMETRLITEYLGARKELLEEREKNLQLRMTAGEHIPNQETKAWELLGRMSEVSKLFDILGGFDV